MATTVTRPGIGAPSFPSEVANLIADAIIQGSPFAASLSRVSATRGSVAFPRATSLTGSAWLAEGQDFPDLDLTTDTLVVATAKIGGIVLITEEAVEDSTIDLAGQITSVVQGAFSRDLDTGLLHGDGAGATPNGVLNQAAEVEGDSLLAAITTAVGELGDLGGTPSVLAALPSTIATEAGRADDVGRPVWPNGWAPQGLTTLGVPTLGGDPVGLIYDASRVFLLVSRDFRVVADRSYAPAFRADKVALKISGRFAVAIPDPASAIRALTVAP